MTLRDAINQYIAWRQAHGVKYKSGSGHPALFLKSVGGETSYNAATTAQVLAFLVGKGPLTRHRENKHGALAGFYRYAISRGYVMSFAAAGQRAEAARSAPPHIYSRDELRRLLRRHREQPTARGSAGCGYFPHAALPSVWNRFARWRGAGVSLWRTSICRGRF